MFPRGITLFELLVVLVVVGILAAVALPAYRHHTLRVNRTEAITALLQLQSAEEAYYLRHDTYTASVEAAPPAGLGISAASTSGKYALSVALAADGQSYIATASPMPGGVQGADQECLAFSIDARGRRAVSGAAGVQRCWK
ncbi:MAG TPA: type IV pilin protein [Steroidobacteraceae bacterium]|nr:type IV pilin protein [Steroidobacteraceae bacterium]